MTSTNQTVQYAPGVEQFSELCYKQQNQTISALDSINSGFGVTLATFYALSAAVSAFLFVKWWQADADAKSRIWRRYGLFTALMCVGCCGGVLAASATIQERYWFQRINYDGIVSCPNTIAGYVDCLASKAVFVAQSTYWDGVSGVPNGIEFLCLCVAKLLVLERMVDFVIMAKNASRWVMIAARVAVAATTILNLINLSILAAASSYLSTASSYSMEVAAELRSPTFLQRQFVACVFLQPPQNCKAADDFNTQTEYVDKALRIKSFASICEVLSLVIIIVSFVVAGISCIRRFRQASFNGITSVGNISVQRQIIVTVSTVFSTYLLRSAFAVVLAVSRYDNKLYSIVDRNNPCDEICKPCQGLANLVQAWERLTPEFRDLIFLLSSPLTMLVALWGMSGHHVRQLLPFLRTQDPTGQSMTAMVINRKQQLSKQEVTGSVAASRTTG